MQLVAVRIGVCVRVNVLRLLRVSVSCPQYGLPAQIHSGPLAPACACGWGSGYRIGTAHQRAFRGYHVNSIDGEAGSILGRQMVLCNIKSL